MILAPTDKQSRYREKDGRIDNDKTLSIRGVLGDVDDEASSYLGADHRCSVGMCNALCVGPVVERICCN